MENQSFVINGVLLNVRYMKKKTGKGFWAVALILLDGEDQPASVFFDQASVSFADGIDEAHSIGCPCSLYFNLSVWGGELKARFEALEVYPLCDNTKKKGGE